MHYYKHHIGDHRSQTMHLSNEEDLAYRRLKDWYLDTEKPIPLETQWVSRRLRVACEALESVLQDFFQRTENGWTNAALDKIVSDYQAQNAKNAVNGRKGGRPKAKKEQEKNPLGSQSEPSRKPNQEPRTNNQEPITNTKGEVLEASRVHTREEPPAPIPKTFPELVDDFVQPPPKATATATMYGATCIALKAAGIADVAPGNLEFRALVDAGIGIDVFTEVAAKAVATGKGRFKYVIAAVNGQIKDAQATAAAAKSATPLRAIAGGKAAYQNPLKVADAAAETEKARRMLFGGTPPDDPNTVDVDARFVGDMKGVAYA